MTSSNDTKLFKLSKIQQLVDLNGDLTNFNLTFKATSKNGSPFQALVVDQTTLDSVPNLEYKKVTDGVISGNIVADKGVYQNYFLILKADNPCDCEITIDKKEIPAKKHPELTHEKVVENYLENSESTVNWKLIFTVIVIVIAIYFLYSNNASKNNLQKSFVDSIPTNELSKSVASDASNNLNFRSQSLQSRLNSLNTAY